MSNTMDEMVKAVRAHAEMHYEEDGWDYVVECYDRAELARVIGKSTTNEEAIRAVGELVGILDERRKDIEATAW